MKPATRLRFDGPADLLEAAMQHVDESVLISTTQLDPPGPQTVYANEGFYRMTGYTAEEVVGKTPRILQGPKTDRAKLDRCAVASLRRAVLRWGDHQLPQGRLRIRAGVVHRAAPERCGRDNLVDDQPAGRDRASAGPWRSN